MGKSKRKGEGNTREHSRSPKIPRILVSSEEIDEQTEEENDTFVANQQTRNQNSNQGMESILTVRNLENQTVDLSNTNNNRILELRSGNRICRKEQQTEICDDICEPTFNNLGEGEDQENIDEFDRIDINVDMREEDEEFPDEEEEFESDEESSETVTTPVQVPIGSVDSQITFNDRNRIDSAREQERQFQQFRSNPAFENFIKKLVSKEIENSAKKNKTNAQSTPRRPAQDMTRRSVVNKTSTMQPPKGNTTLGVNKVNEKNETVDNIDKRQEKILDDRSKNKEVVKSPSDTTIYAPGLTRQPKGVVLDQIIQGILNTQAAETKVNSQGSVANGSYSNNFNQTRIDKHISDFIEGIRIKSTVTSKASEPVPSTSRQQPNEVYVDEQVDEAKQRANQLILDAERFKATVNNPSGQLSLPQDNPTISADRILFEANQGMAAIPQLNAGDFQAGVSGGTNSSVIALCDDDFFHVSCHVDPIMKQKIENGQFVELEKLLPKQRYGQDDSEMKLVFREGRSFFVPAANQNRINSVRRWEQAFRIYAAIYSQANPHRAAEIWQYVHIINVAASSYIWDNVSNYDTTFRQLMAQNPLRSWSKIYNQMWNLAMKENIPNRGSGNQFSPGSRRQHQGGNNSGSNNKNKVKYCWGHNRGNCKDQAKCKFVHRCSYCDAGDHIRTSCPKKSNN